MLPCQLQEHLFVLKEDGRHSIMRVLLVPFLLEVTEEPPAEQTDTQFRIGALAVVLNFLNEGLVLWRVFSNNGLLTAQSLLRFHWSQDHCQLRTADLNVQP